MEYEKSKLYVYKPHIVALNNKHNVEIFYDAIKP